MDFKARAQASLADAGLQSKLASIKGKFVDMRAAAVRELVENALDAQATHITLALWPDQGRVRVADNGTAMARN